RAERTARLAHRMASGQASMQSPAWRCPLPSDAPRSIERSLPLAEPAQQRTEPPGGEERGDRHPHDGAAQMPLVTDATPVATHNEEHGDQGVAEHEDRSGDGNGREHKRYRRRGTEHDGSPPAAQ